MQGFITHNFRLLSVLNKIPDLPNEKAFPNGKCPVNVKKMENIRPVIKYTDHYHQVSGLLAWETTSKKG
jgi:hypothetical protein